MMNTLARIFLSIIAIPVFSRLYGRFTRIKRPRVLVLKIIDFFKSIYKIEMDEFAGKAEDYPSLAEFFVRPLDPKKRPLIPKEDKIVSPADGILKEIETVYEDKATQVKGKNYALSELIRDTIDFSKGWHVATIYLSPQNYHRFHYPISGKIEGYCHVRGPLFPVNSLGTSLVKNLFVRNERIVTRLITHGLHFYAVAVGATFVGSIKMVFIEKIKRDKRWKELNLEVKQQDEMGRFELGSTIILVVPEELAQPLSEKTEQPIKVGEPIFSLKK
jgi:phosphatidylserine decarboxylase